MPSETTCYTIYRTSASSLTDGFLDVPAGYQDIQGHFLHHGNDCHRHRGGNSESARLLSALGTAATGTPAISGTRALGIRQTVIVIAVVPHAALSIGVADTGSGLCLNAQRQAEDQQHGEQQNFHVGKYTGKKTPRP